MKKRKVVKKNDERETSMIASIRSLHYIYLQLQVFKKLRNALDVMILSMRMRNVHP